MEKVTITKINYDDKKKDGTPILSRTGKPSYKVGILTKEYGPTWINGFLPFAPDKWLNTEQELEIYDDPKWGKSFKLPPKASGMSENDKHLLKKMAEELYSINWKIQSLVQRLEAAGVITKIVDTVPGTQITYPAREKEEIPFEDDLASLEESAGRAMTN